MPLNGKVRTRFAPSPTGYMHVGNLRTALYAYLLAKKNDGAFILRIEDTDRERYVEGAVDIIYDTLRKTGLVWDEGPDIGGPVGPYVQSERMGMFKAYAEELVKKGHAYYCFCEKTESEEDTAGITSEEIAAVGVQAQQSEQDKINRSSYNDDAREFNARLEKFPVNLLRFVAGVEPLATYDLDE